MDPDDIIPLLAEIRELQREHLDEYRRVTRESLELQRQAVRRQEKFARLYRGVLVASVLIVCGLILLLIALFGGRR
jgi:hypothetical protein